MNNVLLVPNQALRFLPTEEAALTAAAGEKVWVEQNGSAVSIPVTVGFTNGEFSEISGGNITTDTAVIVDIEREARSQASGGGPF